MSDTPRTDAKARHFWDQWRIANVVQVEFARTLERELAEAMRESSRLADRLSGAELERDRLGEIKPETK